MRVEFKKLLEKLGVNRGLEPYETHPWFHYDEENNTSCSAEVRMGPGGVDLEAEIQFLTDPSDEESEGAETSSSSGTEQIMRMRAEPVVDGLWSPKQLKVKGEDYTGKMHNWEEKGCDFFRSCIESIQMGEMPVIDDLIKKNLSDDSSGGKGRAGRVGRKSPKVKPGALLGMGKPGGGR